MNVILKRTIWFVLVGLLPAWATGETAFCAGAPIEVYIVAGQSNAVGYNSTSTYTPSPFPASLQNQPNVMFWPGSNTATGSNWTTLKVGLSGVSAYAFGPEVSFGRDMVAAKPGTQIAIIKYAQGGTAIARSADYNDIVPQYAGFNDHGTNWHFPEPGKATGRMYTGLLSNVTNALKVLQDQGKSYHLAGVLWMQGEMEAGMSLGMSNDYQMLLTGLISHLRTDLNEPNLPFVIGQISDMWMHSVIVQTAQKNVSQTVPNTALAVTADLPRPPNDAHYTSNGMVTLGSRFATQMQTLNMPEPGTVTMLFTGLTCLMACVWRRMR